MLEDIQPGGGQGARVDVLCVSGSVERWLGGTAVDFGQRVLQQLDGGQNLTGEKNKGWSAELFQAKTRPRHINIVHNCSR